MAVVCHVNPRVNHGGALVPSKSVSLRMKRPYSETEGNETNEEAISFSRHCRAMWSGILNSYPKFLKLQRTCSDKYMTAFLRLFDDPKIRNFLWVDSCYKIADNYLLAMVYVYFKRANLSIDRYNAFNFYTALYLANDIEEDDEDDKYEIFIWATGDEWMKDYPLLLHNRDRLWKKMNFRAIVSRKTCEEVIAVVPDHSIWTRHRQRHHGGALRNYMKPSTPHYGRSSPLFCETCMNGDKEGRVTLYKTDASFSTRNTDFLDDIDLDYKQLYHKSLSATTDYHNPISYSTDDSFSSLNSSSYPRAKTQQCKSKHKGREE